MEIVKRKSVNDALYKYCHLAGKDDFIEVTEWTNGEGFDINIGKSTRNEFLQITHGELDAIKMLTIYLCSQQK